MQVRFPEQPGVLLSPVSRNTSWEHTARCLHRQAYFFAYSLPNTP